MWLTQKDIELFHLRLLRLHVRDLKSFVDRTFNERSFEEAAVAQVIVVIARHHDRKAIALQITPQQLRTLFGYICRISVVSQLT